MCGPCPTGYTGDGVKCLGTCGCHNANIIHYFSCIHADIDECIDTSLCDQVCENTVGSYTCGCYEGYVMTENQCQGTYMHTYVPTY